MSVNIHNFDISLLRNLPHHLHALSLKMIDHLHFGRKFLFSTSEPYLKLLLNTGKPFLKRFVQYKVIKACIAKTKTFYNYSKVPPLRNCIIRNSGLILVNKIPVYKKLSRLIHIEIFEYGSNKSQFSRNKNESFKPKLL